MDPLDDEAFKLEFLSKMSEVLGYSRPERDDTWHGQMLLNAVNSTKNEIARLRVLMEEYHVFSETLRSQSA